MSFTLSKNIIIADDDKDDQMLIKEALDNYDTPVNITTVSDGKQLMVHLNEAPVILPDLILLDLNMPNKNGAECLAEINADQILRNIPVVVLSTSKRTLDIESCFNNGARLFFTKPCTFEDLNILIHAIMDIDWFHFNKIQDKQLFIKIASNGLLPDKIKAIA